MPYNILRDTKAQTLEQAQKAFDADPFYFVAPNDTVKISQLALRQFLQACGFGRYYEGPLSWFYIQDHGVMVERVDEVMIRNFVRHFLETLPAKPRADGVRPVEVLEVFSRAPGVYLGRDKLELLAPRQLTFIQGDDEDAFFYYSNCVVMVTASRVHTLPYESFPGNVWKPHIKDRPFISRAGEPLHSHDWAKHLRLITGGSTRRYLSLCSCLGYLCHRYKDPSITKAVILMDEALSTSEEGRTGKSVTLQSLRHIVETLSWEARRFNIYNRFVWQDVTPEIDVLDFNDASQHFPFAGLFPMLTGDMTRERKGENRVTIPFSNVPKVCISTNYAVEGRGASFNARTHVVELAPAYTETVSPVDIFGRRFFSDWREEDWVIFDNLMMQCVQLFLHSGLIEYKRKTLHFKKVLQEVSDPDAFPDNQAFVRFMLDYPTGQHMADTVLADFREEHPHREYLQDLTQTRFTQWVNAFLSEYRCGRTFRANGVTKYTIVEGPHSIERLQPEDVADEAWPIPEDMPVPGAAGVPSHEANGARALHDLTAEEWDRMRTPSPSGTPSHAMRSPVADRARHRLVDPGPQDATPTDAPQGTADEVSADRPDGDEDDTEAEAPF